MTQVYDILTKIKDRLQANPNVFSVTYGDLTEVDLNKTTIFPLSHIKITDVEFDASVINFRINLICADVVDYSKDDVSDDLFNLNANLIDVHNTQLQVINDIIQQFRRGGLYSDKYQLIVNPTANAFTDRFENSLAGWEVNIDVQVSNDISVC